MTTRTGTELNDGSNKQAIVHVGSSSTSSLTGQNSNGIGRQKSNLRSASAKYYDVASTILGGSGDVEEVFLNAAKNGNVGKLDQLIGQSGNVGLDIDCKDKRTGNTALIWAAKRGHVKIVETLLRHGADATLCNHEAQTAVEIAHSSVRTILLDWVETQKNINDQLLLQASWQGNLSVVKKILTSEKRSVDINCRNIEGLTPLMLVTRDVQLFERLSVQLNRYYSPVQVADELIKAKANIHVTDNDGKSSLHYASQSRAGCADKLVSILIAGGMDIELRDKNLFAPIHLAAQLGNTNNVIALADGGSDVNIKGFAGSTPLHVTAYNDHQKTADTLLSYGADVTLQDDRGLTPVDLAKTRKMKNMLKEAWIEATKCNTARTALKSEEGNNTKGAAVKKRPEVIFDCLPNNSQNIVQTSSGSRILSNVERCKQAEKKILQEVEALKAAHPVLSRETTRILGTTRSKILPQIGRSKSPENSTSQTFMNPDTASGSTIEIRDANQLTEDARKQLMSRGRSVSEIKLGIGRQSLLFGSVSTDDETFISERTVTRFSRTSPFKNKVINGDQSKHRRSGSDPSTPSMRDLAECCDSILPPSRAKSKLVLGHRQHTLNKTPPTSQTFITQSSSTSVEKRLSPDDEVFTMAESLDELPRCHSMLKEEFVIAESRPREMASGSDPTSSSSSSLSSISPRDLALVQQSCSRTHKHEIRQLETLIEQQAFLSSSELHGLEGGVRPIIKKPKQRVRSENSLSSSLESESEVDVKSYKLLSSIKSRNKNFDMDDKIISSSSESSSSIHRSQSLEFISPRLPLDSSVSPKFQRNENPLSHSDDNINFAQKKAGAQLSSKSSNMGEIPKLDISQPRKLSDDVTDKTSQKPMMIKPFSGKARVLVSADFENWVSGAKNVSTFKKSTQNKLKSSSAVKSHPYLEGLSTVSDTDNSSPNNDENLSKQQSIIMNHHNGMLEEGEAKPDNRNKILNVKDFAHENTKDNNSDKKTINLRAREVFCKDTDVSVSDGKEAMPNKNSRDVNHSAANIGSFSAAHPTAKLPLESGDNITKETVVLSSHGKRLDEKFISAQHKETRPKPSTKKSLESSGMDLKSKFVNKAALIEKTILNNQRADIKVCENINVLKSGDVQSVKVNKDKESAAAKRVTQHSSISVVRTGNSKSLVKKIVSVKQMTPTCKNTSTKIQTAPVKASATQNSPVNKPETNFEAILSKNLPQKQVQNETMASKQNTITHLPTSFQSAYNNSAQISSTKPAVKIVTACQTTSPGCSIQDSIQKRATQTLAPQDQKSDQINGQPIEATINIESKVSSSTVKCQTLDCVLPINTPVIVDPFAEFAQSHVSVIEIPSKDAGSKTKKSISTKYHKKVSSGKRPNSGSSRQSSAGKKRIGKGKELKAEKEQRPRSTKKSGRGKNEKEDKDELDDQTEAVRSDVTLVTGIGWQMETSCSNMEKIQVSREINLYDSDTELTERDHPSKNMHLMKIFKENIGEPSPRFLEMKCQKSVLDIELPAEDDGYPLMNLDMTNQFPKVFERNEWDVSKSYNYQNIYHNDRSPGQLTTISEASFSSRATGIISDIETSLKGETKVQHHKASDSAQLVKLEKRKPVSEEDASNYVNIQNHKISQEGKQTERSQNAVQRKFSERENEVKMDRKEVQEDDLDDVIEEILSSTTSSLSSTLKNASYISGYNSGSHTMTYGDRKILAKMTKLNQDSPFYATSSLVAKVDRAKDRNNLEMREVGDYQDTSQVSASSAKEKEQVGRIPDNSFLLKPPISIRSSLIEEGTPRQMSIRRSCSTKAVRRRTMDEVVGSEVNEEEAKHLAKVINSFKQMELTSVCQEGGSAKSSFRNSGILLVTHDTSGTSRPGSSNGSFRSKGRFRELKDGINTSVAKISADAKLTEKLSVKNDAIRFGISEEEAELLEKLSSTDDSFVPIPIIETNLTETRRGSLASSEFNTGDTIKGENDTIQWKKGNILGKGAFGTVWCGLTNEGQLIAVKQIELTTMDKLKAQLEYEKVQEEVELLKTLEHTNIVGYLGTSLEDNIVSIFMQFIPGGSLASILARFGALDEAVFRRYTKQILEGVRYLHDNDVIHRDLKGANVMLMPNGVIKLIDFGCAKRMCINLSISQTEILKSMKGTPYWMAPEVVNETGHGKKSDIWSIGCTVFEMATRKPPWSDMNPMAAIFAIGSPERPVPSLDEKFSEDARNFVVQCMTRDQELRPDAHQLLQHPFITRRPSKKS